MAKVDLACIEPRMKAKIGPLLVSLYRSPAIIKKMISEGSIITYDDVLLENTVRWLKDSAVCKRLSAEEKKWVYTLSSNESGIDDSALQSVAKVMIPKWLNLKTGLDSLDSFKCIEGFINKNRCVKDPSTITRRNMMDLDPSKVFEEEDVYEVAAWIRDQINWDEKGFEFTRSLAATLQRTGNLEEAELKYKQALTLLKKKLEEKAPARSEQGMTLMNQNLQALYGLAQTYGLMEKWEIALQTLMPVTKALENGEDALESGSLETDKQELFGFVAIWHRKIGQFGAAREIYEKILQSKPEDYSTIFEMTSLMCDQHHFIDALEHLQRLERSKDSRTGRDQLSEMFHAHADDPDYHHIIALIYKKTKKLNLIKVHYQRITRALESAKQAHHEEDENSFQSLRGNLNYHLASLLYRHRENDLDRQNAIELWKEVLTYCNEDEDFYIYYLQQCCASMLLRVYLLQAKEAEHSSDAARQLREKAEKLARDQGSLWGPYIPDYVYKSQLGRYYSSVGLKEQARKTLKPDVELGIKLLLDEDLKNDWEGYRKLGDAFMDFGDDANAVAAWCMIQPTNGISGLGKISQHSVPGKGNPKDSVNENSQTPVQSEHSSDDTIAEAHAVGDVKEPDSRIIDKAESRLPPLKRAPTSYLSKKPKGPLGYSCDGRCGKNWTFADDINVCRQCIDVQFDARCLVKLRSDELIRNVCDQSHTFLHIPAWTREHYERAGKNLVLVQNNIMSVKDWLEKIRQEWGITDEEVQSEPGLVEE